VDGNRVKVKMNIVSDNNDAGLYQQTAMPKLPTSSDDEIAKVSKLSAVWLAQQQRWQPWREQAIKCYEYVLGPGQLSKSVREKLAKEHRPALVYDLMLPLQVYIAGTLVTNKTAMRAVPKRSGDEAGVEMANVLVSDWWMANCDGYDEIAKAGIDASICGLGFINNRYDMSEDVEGMGITEAADPLMIMADPDAPIHKPKKWRYYSVSGYYGAEEIIAIYGTSLSAETKALIRERAKLLEGNYQELGKPQGWLRRVWNGTMDWLGVKSTVEGNTYKTDFIDAANGLYRVIEFHDKRIATKRAFYDPITRETIELKTDPLDESEVAQLKAQYSIGRVVETEQTEYWKTVAAPGLLPDKLIFEKPYEEKVQGKGWQHTVVVGYDFHWDPTKVIGLQNSLLDAQDGYNQQRMTMLELLMDMVNPPTEAEEESISPEHMEAWTTKERGPMRFYKKNAKKPERVEPQTAALTGLSNFAEENRDLVQKLTGISPNSMSFKESNNESGTLYSARVSQGMVMVNYFFSHIQKATKATFNFNYGLIQEYLTTPRAVRILGEPEDGMDMPGMVKSEKETGAYWLQVNWPTLTGVLNDVRQGQYDFTPNTAQLGQTQKMMKFYEAMEFRKSIPDEFVKFDELFDLWDSPVAKKMGAFATAIMKMKMQQLGIQSEVAQSGAGAAIVENKVKQAAGMMGAQQIAAQAASRVGA
jgi:hypothetical protein